jgi:16S rRNA (guanine1516-N2)-methyltransferase
VFAVVDDEQLADKYQLALIDEHETSNYQAWLFWQAGQLALAQNYLAGLKPLVLDFNAGKTAFRLKQTQHIKEPIGRACGISKGRRPSVVDATAGLAQDGLLLAALGAQVTLIEQHPLLHALISDALDRAAQGPGWLANIIQSVSLVHADARRWLTDNPAQVIYLDPMYPEAGHERSAQVKKPMQILRGLPGTETDTSMLFEIARQSCTERLVVKRPDWAASLTDERPAERLDTRTHHYDIYLSRSAH